MNEEETDHLRHRPNVKKTERKNSEDIRLPQKAWRLYRVDGRRCSANCNSRISYSLENANIERHSNFAIRARYRAVTGVETTATSFLRYSTLFMESRMDTALRVGVVPSSVMAVVRPDVFRNTLGKHPSTIVSMVTKLLIRRATLSARHSRVNSSISVLSRSFSPSYVYAFSA